MAFDYLAGLSANLLTDSGVVFSGDTDDSNFPHENIATGRPWEMMRFAAVGADDYIQADLGSAQSVDFCSVHFHNLDAGIVVKLARDITGSTAVATMTKASPSFFAEFVSVSDRYWRLTFEGTNSSAIYIGEWVLGAKSTLTRNQDWGWSVRYHMPQRRVAGPSGITLAHNLSEQWLRSLAFSFASLTDAQLDEHLDTMLDGCAWGEEPLVIAPDTNRTDLVIHGRPSAEMSTIIEPNSAGTGFWRHAIEVLEDPGPIIVK